MPAYPRKIEALAEAIMHYSGYQDPSSALHAARNPGGLKATSMKHASNQLGQRVFMSFIDGVQALLFDLKTKLSGQSWAELTKESDLRDLAASYALASTNATSWAKFLRASLQDQSISADTKLEYFLRK